MILSHLPQGASTASQRPHERAATLVEVAFALPVLMMMLLGFIDLGMAVFQSSQASSAAADGARVGIIRHDQADVANSPDRLAIDAAVRGKLAGQQVDAITVSCIDRDDAAIACVDADPEVDRLRVVVSWTYRPISPMGQMIPGKVLTGRATMGLIGQPAGMTATTTVPASTTSTSTTAPTSSTTSTAPPTTTTTAPPVGCLIAGLSAEPATMDVKNNGSLQSALDLTLTTNANPGCTLLTVRITTNGVTEEVVAFNKITATRWTATIEKNGFKWTPGSKVGAAYTGPTYLSTHPLVTLT